MKSGTVALGCGLSSAAIVFRDAIKPRLRLFGLPYSLGSDRPARCNKLLVKFIGRHSKVVPSPIDSIANLVQIFDDRSDRRACPAIAVVIEKTPFAGCCCLQRCHERRGIFFFKFCPANVKASKSMSLGHD